MQVLCFGTFDLFHEGHSFFLKKASEYGFVTVVIARDSTVLNVKKRISIKSQSQRLLAVVQNPYVQRAVLGNTGDKYKIIEDVNPDLILLGYDQTHFTDNLKDALVKRKLGVKVVRLNKSFHPEIFKSSFLREKEHLKQ